MKSEGDERPRILVCDGDDDGRGLRDIVAAAPAADAAILVVDARKGLLDRTFRDSCIARVFGIRCVALAVDKLDLVADAKGAFDAIEATYRPFAARLGIESVTSIPIAALDKWREGVEPARRRAPASAR